MNRSNIYMRHKNKFKSKTSIKRWISATSNSNNKQVQKQTSLARENSSSLSFCENHPVLQAFYQEKHSQLENKATHTSNNMQHISHFSIKINCILANTLTDIISTMIAASKMSLFFRWHICTKPTRSDFATKK